MTRPVVGPLLKRLTRAQKLKLAQEAGTSLNYLYQMVTREKKGEPIRSGPEILGALCKWSTIPGDPKLFITLKDFV